MINFHTFNQIHNLYDELKMKISQIANQLNLNSKTVSRWVKIKEYQPRKPTGKAPCKLDGYKQQIINLLNHHDYSNQQIFQQIKEQGYQGGHSILGDYLRQIRPKHKAAFLSLTFEPAECAQVDWGCYGTIGVGKTRRKLNFFVMVLCYSRMMYVQFSLSQSMEHFLDAHQNAFEYFGGVPKKIMVDNCKVAVLEHRNQEAPKFNLHYLDFAQHYGFKIKACGVRKPYQKGRVESAVAYVKKNFLNGRQLTTLSALNNESKVWLDTVANPRIHGQTKKPPIELLSQEKPCLIPLNAKAYDVGRVVNCSSSKCFQVAFDSNRYSVPSEYAQQKLILKAYPQEVCLFYQDKPIAQHLRCYDRNQRIEDPDHDRQLLQQRRNAQKQRLLRRFLTLSPKAETYFQALKQRQINHFLQIRRIIALCDIYSDQEVGRAIEDAIDFGAYADAYIVNILEQRSRPIGEPAPLHLTRQQDMLEIDLPLPDLDIYQTKQPTLENENEKTK